jgi:hypothetical protein
MTNNDSVLDIAIDVLACSYAGQLLKMRRNEWLPHGARWARGGVAMTQDGTFLGWMAYGNDEHELSCPSWPKQALALTLDQIFPTSVEISIVYSGGDWRRAAAAVNAVLEREGQASCGRISMERTERAERTVTARLAGEAYRRAQFELRLRRTAQHAA